MTVGITKKSPVPTKRETFSLIKVKSCKALLRMPLVCIVGPSGRTVCGRSPVEIVGSNSTGGIDVCLSRVWCVVR